MSSSVVRIGIALAVAATSLLLFALQEQTRPLRFRDRAPMVGLGQVTETWDVAIGDLNGDRWDDVVLSRHRETAQIFINENGERFNLAEEFPAGVDRHGCDMADINKDGMTDTYCTRGAKRGSGEKRNELWLQSRGGIFEDVAVEFGVSDSFGRGRHPAFIDVNLDGFPDLYVANGFPRIDERPSVNRLFLNEGGLSFRSAPEYGLDEAELGGLCVERVDLNEDGFDDLLVCGRGPDNLRLYINDRGVRFVDRSDWLAQRSRGIVLGASVADFDQDGRIDIALLGFGGLQRFSQMRDGFNLVQSIPLRGGQALAHGDIDGDGDTDVYVVRGCARNPDGSFSGPDQSDIVFVWERGELVPVDAEIPSVSTGCGDLVRAFDHDQDGDDEFLVLIGRGEPGPIQLIEHSE